MRTLEQWLRRECDLAIKPASCADCKEDCIPRFVLSCGANVSTVIIKKLAEEPGFYSLPAFADRIADFTGMTLEQHDEMVLKKYRGIWEPGKKRKKARKPEATRIGPERASRAVVAIDNGGIEQERYASASEAAEAPGRSLTGICNRCNRKLSDRTDEFQLYGVTFRWADEWDRLTPEGKKEDIRNLHYEKLHHEAHCRKYEYCGQCHSIAEWARIADLPEEVLRKRIRRGWTFGEAIGTPVREYDGGMSDGEKHESAGECGL